MYGWLTKKRAINCSNCKQTPCLNSEGITLINFTSGAKVTPTAPTLRVGGVYKDIESMIRQDGPTVFIGRLKNGAERSGCTMYPEYYVF